MFTLKTSFSPFPGAVLKGTLGCCRYFQCIPQHWAVSLPSWATFLLSFCSNPQEFLLLPKLDAAEVSLYLLQWGKEFASRGHIWAGFQGEEQRRDGKYMDLHENIFACYVSATALYNISSVLNQPLKFHRSRWHIVSEYSKTFPVKKSWWEVKGIPNVEPGNSRCWLKIPFPFLLLIFRIFPMYLGEKEREVWQTLPLFCTSLLQILFSFLQDGSKHAVPVKKAWSTFVGT